MLATLPPYNLLATILTAYVEEDRNVEQIVAVGIDEEIVKRAARLVDISAARHQAYPQGIRPRQKAPHYKSVQRMVTEPATP